jgi:hypothetical protein
LESLKNFFKKTNLKSHIKNNIKIKCDIKCAKFKILLLFIIENLISDDIYNLLVVYLVNILYKNINSETILSKTRALFTTIGNSATNQKSGFFSELSKLFLHKNSKNNQKFNSEFKLITINESNHTITINFQEITKFINFILVPFFTQTINKTELYKIKLLVNILIIFFNYIYDNQTANTHISSELFHNITAWITFLHKLPNCIPIPKLKEKLIEIIKRPEFTSIEYLASYTHIAEIIVSVISLQSVSNIALGKKCS